MKFLHISDIHLGKKLKGYSLLDDQKFILEQIKETAKNKNVDGIIIAGDIYDTSIPNTDAINLFDRFLTDLYEHNISCYIVSGNHDNIYRVTFGSEIMAKSNIYFAKKYNGYLKPIELKDNINIWLLPFVRPFDVREYHPDFSVGSYEEMMQAILSKADIDTSKTNILVAHQFITFNGKSPDRSESETVALGTLDNIDVSNFDKFDYVALGHIHKSQAMGRKTVRYGGSPLKYSFDEKNQEKSMVLLDVSNKNINLEFIPYKPLHDLKEFEGKFEDLINQQKCEDFVKIILTDEDRIIDVKHKLEKTYSNIMEIIYNNSYTKENKEVKICGNLNELSPVKLFKDFYFMQNNKELDNEQIKIVEDLFEKLNIGGEA